MLWRAGQASMLAALADLLIELVAALLGCGVRRHDDALIGATCRAVCPSLTAPTLLPLLALFGLRPMIDSSALPPLHSTSRPLKMKQAPAAFVPLAANCRDNQEQLGRTQMKQDTKGREASPGQEISIMGAMLRMSPRTIPQT